MKKIIIILLLVSYYAITFAQDTLMDPYHNIKRFTTFDLGISATRINTNNSVFDNYTLIKGKYYPTFNGAIYWNSIHVCKNKKDVFIFKSGILMNSRYTDLTDTIGNDYRFSEGLINIPLLLGYRLPLNHNFISKDLYKVVDINLGAYIGLPYFEKLDLKENIDAPVDGGGNYLKYGLIAEVVYSKLNKKGFGHRIGLRTMIDFKGRFDLTDTKYGIYPSYISVGLFYNFLTI